MKNKILTISIIFILISFVFINSCFAYSETSSYNSNYTFFMPDNVKDDLFSIADQIPELNNINNYYYVLVASSYHRRVQLFIYPKEGSASYIYGPIKNGDGIWASPNILCDFVVYQFGYHSIDLANHTLDINLSSMTRRVYTNSNEMVLLTYTPNDGYFWCVTNMPFYTSADKTSLWVKANDDFFFKAPVAEQPKEELALAEIMKKAGEQATLEVGQIILIVIMTTAGLMVLLIGLKKGLKVLMNGFRH